MKYKAKRADGKGWVEGDKVTTTHFTYILNTSFIPAKSLPSEYFIEVIPETVCRFVKSIEDIKLWEGDKLKGDDDLWVYSLIEWNAENGRFQINGYGYEFSTGEGGEEIIGESIELIDENVFNIEDIDPYELIGNIHDKTETK